MNCPYCMEEIRDEAIVCRFCNRDLLLMLPMIRRIATLEAKIAQLSDSLSALGPGIYPSVGSQTGLTEIPGRSAILDPTGIRFAVALFGSSCLMGLMTYKLLASQLSMSASATASVAGLGILSVLIGFGYPIRLRVVAIAAIVQPIATFAILGTLNWWHLHDGPLPQPLGEVVSDSWTILKFKFLGVWFAILFFAGVWLGQWIRGIFNGKNVPNSIEVSLAARLTPQRPSETEDQFGTRVKQWSAVIAGAAPILTFVATLVTAGFSYLGALAHVSGSK